MEIFRSFKPRMMRLRRNETASRNTSELGQEGVHVVLLGGFSRKQVAADSVFVLLTFSN